MNFEFLDPKEEAELQLLFESLPAARAHAFALLKSEGMMSPAFREADKVLGEILRRSIRIVDDGNPQLRAQAMSFTQAKAVM